MVYSWWELYGSLKHTVDNCHITSDGNAACLYLYGKPERYITNNIIEVLPDTHRLMNKMPLTYVQAAGGHTINREYSQYSQGLSGGIIIRIDLQSSDNEGLTNKYQWTIANNLFMSVGGGITRKCIESL